MTIVRSFQKPFELTDLTEALLMIPNQYGKINQMGLFDVESIAQHTVTVEEINQTIGLITDQPRGVRNNMSKDYTRKLHGFAIPHFPLDDGIKPEDIQGKRAYGSDNVETLDLVRARKLERIRRSHAQTLEVARAKLICTGDVYAPNGTVVTNFYTAFSITRKEVDFVLGTATTELSLKIEEVLAHIADNLLSGETPTEMVALCHPTFFNKLVTHAVVKDAWRYYKDGDQQILRNRLGIGGSDRVFHYAGMTFLEYRGFAPDGSAMITSGEAFAFPLGTMDTFKTYFSPANRFESVNTLGEELYGWEYMDQAGTQIVLQSETNFMNMCRRPACVVRMYSSN